MKTLLFLLLLFSSQQVYSQAYVPMPTDSAVWRYRLYDADYVIQVLDCILYLNGTDTAAHGNTYKKVFSRVHQSFVSIDSALPPVRDVYASYPDTYFGAIRETGRQVFLLNVSGEQLLFDFNAAVGDSIPSSSGNDAVTAIDSVLLGGIYHKRFLTTDSTYYVIEGVGSSRGIIPSFIDGSPNQRLLCFTHPPVLFSPDSSMPCTSVYPFDLGLSAGNIKDENEEINVFPVPAFDELHIATQGSETLSAVILNNIGQRVWEGSFSHQLDIPVMTWAKGLYFLQISGAGLSCLVKKININ